MNSFSLTHLIKLSQLSTSLGFCQKYNFLKRQRTNMSIRDLYMIFFVYTEHFLSINLALVID